MLLYGHWAKVMDFIAFNLLREEVLVEKSKVHHFLRIKSSRIK